MFQKSSLLHTRYTTGTGIAVLITGMVFFASIFAALGLHFYKSEHERALLHWQVVLNLVAEERAKVVDRWFDNHFKGLGSLAENVSLKLYMTEIGMVGEEKAAETAAPDYLRILLEFTADHDGFKPEREPELNMNEGGYPRTAGVALLNKNKKLIASTRFMPPITGALAEFVEKADDKPQQVLDLFTATDNNAPDVRMIAFLVPIQSVQGDDITGYAIGVAELNKDLFSRLYQVGLPYTDSETLLVRKVGSQIEYISPLAMPTGGGELHLNAATKNLDAAELLSQGGGFTERNDYRHRQVLTVAVKLNSVPWFVVHNVSAKEALGESEFRVRLLIAVLALVALVLVVTLFAVWSHASSLRSEQSAKEYREMAIRHASHEKLLRLITDNQLSSMFILDSEGIIRFANAVSGKEAGMIASQMEGHQLADVLGAALAEEYLKHNQHTLETMETESYLQRRKREDGSPMILHIDHIPLPEIPDPHSSEIRSGTLVVENDITATMLEKERRERTLQNLVKVLTSLMDRCVPFFTNHSSRVSRLASIIGIEMGLERNLIRTVQFAGKLMNLGRIFLPRELFTKEGALTLAELRQIQESVQTSANLLESIQFNGPLVETIRQSGERIDGSGFLGMSGDNILITARVLGIAHTFIGMISDRSYRAGMKIEDALQILMQDAGTKYDRAAVLALGHYLENRTHDHGWLLSNAETAIQDSVIDEA